ncbi:MAG: sugar phosphate isomerase/epimerase, partial [Candidatus Bathyarchaeota archaeon]
AFSHFDLPQLGVLLANLELNPASVHAPTTGADISSSNLQERRIAEQLLIDTIFYCKSIKCPILVVHPNILGSNSLLLPDDVQRNNCIDSLGKIVDRTQDHSVKIALENLPDYEGKGRVASRVVDLIEIIEKVGSQNVGICVDTGHTNITKHQNLAKKLKMSLEDEIMQAGKYLCTLHINDNNGKEDIHLVPGDGNIEWALVIRSLRQVNYKGIFMMEILEREDSDEQARRSYQKGAELLGIN